METVAVDAVRDDIDGGKFASAALRAQPVKSAFELLVGKLRVDHDPVGLLERRGILFIRDPAVERDVTGDRPACAAWGGAVGLIGTCFAGCAVMVCSLRCDAAQACSTQDHSRAMAHRSWLSVIPARGVVTSITP